jgi:DNA repair protein RadC
VFVEERSRPAEAGTADDRPRERILSRGVETLSDRDLLAVVLGSGSATCDVFTLAGRVLAVLDRDNFESDPAELMRIAGMGPAKATLLAAAMELGRRVVAPRNYRIRRPGDAVPLLQHYADRPQEHFLTVTLNGAHEVTAIRVVSVGLVNRTLVHPREVFADAVTDRATAIICAHNHPSGNVTPSADDRLVTQSLQQAGEILGVRLIDHIIFSARGFYSFLDHGEL